MSSISEYYKKFTGEDTFNEAKQIFEKDISESQKINRELESYVNMIGDCVSKEIDKINYSKEYIKSVLFIDFATKMKWLKDVDVDEAFMKEIFSVADLIRSPHYRHKDELFLIDFDEHSFKSNALAILTGGFWSRKKAEQTKTNVEEEKKRLEEESARLNAEKERLKNVNKSLKQIVSQFKDLINIYESMLVLLDNSLNYLMVKCIGFNHIMKKISIKHLPKQQQKEIVVLVTMSIILNNLVNIPFTIDAKKDTIESYKKNVKKLRDKYDIEYKKVA